MIALVISHHICFANSKRPSVEIVYEVYDTGEMSGARSAALVISRAIQQAGSLELLCQPLPERMRSDESIVGLDFETPLKTSAKILVRPYKSSPLSFPFILLYQFHRSVRLFKMKFEEVAH